MVDQVMRTILGVVFRAVLLLAGLIFLASLFVAALLLLAVWLARALWAKLTGQPVLPWTFRVDKQAVWQRFYPAEPGRSGSAQRDDSNVIDVEPKEPREIRLPEQ